MPNPLALCGDPHRPARFRGDLTSQRRKGETT
jgi:hypothetical protein